MERVGNLKQVHILKHVLKDEFTDTKLEQVYKEDLLFDL
jgi:hypothetical protein